MPADAVARSLGSPSAKISVSVLFSDGKALICGGPRIPPGALGITGIALLGGDTRPFFITPPPAAPSVHYDTLLAASPPAFLNAGARKNVRTAPNLPPRHSEGHLRCR